MPRLPVVKPRAVLRALLRAGFYIDRVTGSHYILRHPDRSDLRITVPLHNRDLKRKTLATIIAQAGMTVEEFIGLL